MKKCYTCKKSKPETEFHKRSDRPDGLTQSCKECNRIRRREHYKNNTKKISLTTQQHQFLFNIIHGLIDQIECSDSNFNPQYLKKLNEISKKLI